MYQYICPIVLASSDCCTFGSTNLATIGVTYVGAKCVSISSSNSSPYGPTNSDTNIQSDGSSFGGPIIYPHGCTVGNSHHLTFNIANSCTNACTNRRPNSQPDRIPNKFTNCKSYIHPVISPNADSHKSPNGYPKLCTYSKSIPCAIVVTYRSPNGYTNCYSNSGSFSRSNSTTVYSTDSAMQSIQKPNRRLRMYSFNPE